MWHLINFNQFNDRKQAGWNGSWLHGALIWFSKGNPTYPDSIRMEWSVPTTSCAIGATFKDDTSMRLHVAIPLLFSLWITLNTRWLTWLVTKLTPSVVHDPYSGWESNLSFSDWTLRWIPVGRIHEWRSRDPWWVRGIGLNLPDLLFGRRKYIHEILGDWKDVIIPMPEGTYTGKCRFEKRTWFRPRLPFRTLSRNTTEFQADSGIPFPGKGENSWDCGMDGLWGTGSEGHNIPKCIGKVVESVLETREKRTGTVNWRPEPETGVLCSSTPGCGCSK